MAKPKAKQKPKLYVGQSDWYLFWKIEDKNRRLVEKRKLKLTRENKNRFWHEAASRILPTLENLVPLCEREGREDQEIYGEYIDSRDYEIIREFPPHKPLTKEQEFSLIRRINCMHIAY